MNKPDNTYTEKDYQQDINSLKNVTLNRLKRINEVIRLNRWKMTKESLAYYKTKRKETDQLLSSIKTNMDKLGFNDLKNQYMNFVIEDPRFL